MLEIARWESVWQVVVDLWLLLAGLAVDWLEGQAK